MARYREFVRWLKDHRDRIDQIESAVTEQELDEVLAQVEVTTDIIQNLVVNETFVNEIFNYNTYITNLITEITNVINGKKGQVDELATLDSEGKLTETQIPDKISPIGSLAFVFDGGGSEIPDGKQLDIEIPFDCNLTGWTILADQSGDIVIDVWRDTYANFPPTDSDSITSGFEPEIVASGSKAQNLDISNWGSTSLVAGDVIRVNVDSCTIITRATLTLRFERT